MYLFKLLQERRDFHFVLKASFLEIYNEKVGLLEHVKFSPMTNIQQKISFR